MAAFYGVQPSPVDDTVWGQSMDVGFSRIDQPGYIIRLDPGLEPDRDRARRGVPAARRGLRLARPRPRPPTAWCGRCSRAATWRASTARKCKGPLNGPEAIDRQACARRAGRSTRCPARSSRASTDPGSANHAYYIWVDRYNTLGLGNERADRLDQRRRVAARRSSTASSSTLRVPYPLGFFTKNVDGRIDDPNAGWKGKGCGRCRARAPSFHNEGGTQNRPKVYKVQMRPDPLAN